MNEYMISQWNSVVQKRDEVVILGDFIMSKDVKRAKEIILRLNGKKFMVLGNHDHVLRKTTFDTTLFKKMSDYMELHDNNRRVICSHYPVMCYNRQYDLVNGKAHSYMLHGHIHATQDQEFVDRFVLDNRKRTRTVTTKDGENITLPIPCEIINCFCMYSDYKPLPLDEWKVINDKRLAIYS
jgi:calcineurin-like phosphoesterase family protein